MTSPEKPAPRPAASFLLWDMAGTLIPYDPVSGRPGPLPGCDEFLPELRRDFRMVVTTGDGTASARDYLAGCDILPYLEGVFGDLNHPVGKPYGQILRELGGDPETSLAIGDRLRADVPSDTGEIVTLLINQDGEVASAGMVAFMTHILKKQGGTFPQAFRLLATGAAPDPERAGPAGGGAVTAAWKRNDGFEYRLWEFEHPALEGPRLVLAI
jgi:hypothetical protein